MSIGQQRVSDLKPFAPAELRECLVWYTVLIPNLLPIESFSTREYAEIAVKGFPTAKVRPFCTDPVTQERIYLDEDSDLRWPRPVPTEAV
jgi:hypothetical protein